MASSDINKKRIIILTLMIGALLLTLLKRLYQHVDITQAASIVTVVSIIAAYIIEKFISYRKSRAKKNE